MLDVKTPLSKVHRAVRRINDLSTFAAKPGSWGSINTAGCIVKIAATATQPKVLKLIMGNASTNIYESNDVKVGSISTLEGYVRAAVDTDGYVQSNSTGTALTYDQGADLTVSYTSAAISTLDLGKLMPATINDVVVGRVENVDTVLAQLTFETVSPHIKAA